MAVVPSYGSTAGGTVVVVYGVSFESSVSALCVFGDVSVLALVLNSTAIECETPSVPMSQTVAVSIILDDTPYLSTTTFLYVSPVKIQSIYPTAGPLRGQSVVKVQGSGK